MSVTSLLFRVTDISPVGFDLLVAVNIKTGLLGATQCSLLDIQSKSVITSRKGLNILCCYNQAAKCYV
jgi:hypothetical protein